MTETPMKGKRYAGDAYMEDVSNLALSATDKVAERFDLTDAQYERLLYKFEEVLEEFFNYPSYRNYN